MDSQITHAYHALKSGTIDAGMVMMKYRGKVENKGKPGDHTEAGAALTVIDEIAQELILSKLYRANRRVMVNAEENTPLRKLFENNSGNVTVHLDPLDGTLSYLKNRGMFASGAAISVDGIFTHTVVYAPARGRLYSASPKEQGVVQISDYVAKDKFTEKTLFAKKIFSEKGIKLLEDLGYEVIQDNYGAHVTSLDAVLDDIAGVIHGFTNPHDMLIASAFARHYNKVPHGIEGKEITGKDLVMHMENGLPVYERIPVIGYFSNESKDKILPLMLDRALWDEKFIEKVNY